MTTYNVNFALTAGGLATPLSLAPSSIKRIKPDAVVTASGLRKTNGLPGYQFFWQITDPVDLDYIFDRTGGDTDSSVAGFVRVPDWVQRSSSAPTWSDWYAFLDQPLEGEFRQGPNRYNLMVEVRQMVLYQTLA